MQTLLKAAITVALPALLSGSLSLTSCAVDGCTVDPSDPRCTAMPSPDVNLVTSRLAKSGGRLKVAVKNLNQGEQIEVTLGAQGPKVTGFMQQADGTWEGMVSAAVLANIPLGPLSALVAAGSKTQTKTLHIYTPPVFMEDSKKIQLNIASRQPNWLQVSQSHVFATLDSGTDRRINEYAVSGTTFAQQATRDIHLGLLAPGWFIDVSETHTFRLSAPSGTTSTLDFAELNPGTGGYAVMKMFNLAKADALAVDHQSMFVAIAGEGTDGTLKAFGVPPIGQPTSAPMVNVNSVPSGKQAVLLAWGLIDNDALIDLVAIHSDNTFAVYLQKSGTGLTYDATFSMGLQTAAGLPSAAGPAPAFAVGDIDRDGLDDVMISPSGSMQVFQLANEGTGAFTKGNLVGGFAADAIAIGDITSDQKVDLVVASKSPAVLYGYPNQSP